MQEQEQGYSGLEFWDRDLELGPLPGRGEGRRDGTGRDDELAHHVGIASSRCPSVSLCMRLVKAGWKGQGWCGFGSRLDQKASDTRHPFWSSRLGQTAHGSLLDLTKKTKTKKPPRHGMGVSSLVDVHLDALDRLV